ncbi:MAG: hypothetical protein EP305_03670 [Bacteroidetes bacterium]|nr:MAG: hypothetical protein EP305_03670 [Bacteroidota bacterium]
MKSLLQYSFILFILGFVLNSCNEEVELIGDFQETAVVYGILDQADSIHFVKINRAFIGPGNAYEIAQIPDSSYFTDVNATIKEYVNGALTRTWTLTDTLIDNKDENGVFYAPQQKMYYFHTINQSPLNPSATYKLNIDINNGELIVTGETQLVTGLSTTASSQNYTFKFADNPGSYTASSVAVGTGNAYVVNTSLDISFNEFIGATSTPKSFKWTLGESEVVPGSSKTFSANGQTFYNLIKSNITNDPLIDRRTFGSITVTITGGAEELYNYMTVNKPSSSLAQSKPTYTNLSIEGDGRVIGIFSSRQTLKFVKPFFVSAAQAYIRAIDQKSTRELCTGPITGLLYFCSNHPGDQTQTFACQ